MSAQETNGRPLYNSNIIRSYIRLINHRYSFIDLNDLLDYAEMKMYQIEDDGHWFTQKEVNRFYERLVQLTGKQDIAREAGMYSTSPVSLGLMRI